MKGKLAVVVFEDKIKKLMNKRGAYYDECVKCLVQAAFFDRDFGDFGRMRQ
jgi:hypothetical protein